MNDKHEHEPHEGDDGNGALTKDDEYYASKSGGRQDDGEGGHARRRLDELLSQRVPDQPDAGETSTKDFPDKDSKAEPPSSDQAPPPSKKQPDKGAPGEG